MAAHRAAEARASESSSMTILSRPVLFDHLLELFPTRCYRIKPVSARSAFRSIVTPREGHCIGSTIRSQVPLSRP